MTVENNYDCSKMVTRPANYASAERDPALRQRPLISRFPWPGSSEKQQTLSTAVDPPERSPASSNASSFSDTSSLRSWSRVSTAPSSPPSSPGTKHESTDRDLYSISFLRQDEPHEQPTTLPPLRRESAPECRLPSVNSLVPHRRESGPAVPRNGCLDIKVKLCSSPTLDSFSSSNYVLSKSSSPRDYRCHDYVATALERARKEFSQHTKDVHFSCYSTPRRAPALPRISTSRTYNYGYYSDDSDCALKRVQAGRIRKSSSDVVTAASPCTRSGSKAPHINKRYTIEQMHFIRYLAIDIKRHWNDIEEIFRKQFPPQPNVDRKTQGCQGVYYRENKEIPLLNEETNGLEFLQNGHVAKQEKPCRQQANNKELYGLINLFPEEAMTYPWVLEEDRRRAQGLSISRSREREQAKQKAIKSGLWEEILTDGSCACCVNHKRSKT